MNFKPKLLNILMVFGDPKGFFMRSLLSFFLPFFLFSCAHNNPQEKFMMGNRYYQNAPEVKAMYYQAYNIAKSYLKENVLGKKKQQCIVLDIDETVLDNSPYQGWLYKTKNNYSSATWEEWVHEAKALALPGAVEFIKLAQKNKIRTLFITNRKQHLVSSTLKNLKLVGLEVEEKDIVGRTTTSSKEQRRKEMSRGCEIAMLIGDSLADFGEMFEGPHNLRVQATHKYAKNWGGKFIILPNPMYGDWVRGAGSLPLKSFK